ncbi:AAA family ATPase [Nonomuraea sp. K274]|uniref:AAA family ATPase n=1 Tax=Nonomuraea cypriaca TaxID=1187855 RepID=A0A931AI59_9ACTN|nr:LuxR family transcriptional regulator [Nonomuraea cypriaca]MBF8190585.1 AAA family ATPase [Nonomuraea cypriaca]
MRGREREWRHVDGLLQALRRGGGGTLLVDGEPGSGKSRLLAEAAGAASDRGVSVVHGSVEELGELSPCAMLLAALDLRSEPGMGYEGSSVGPDPRVLERVKAGFEKRAREPVLAVFDDLQRADPVTLKTLNALHDLFAARPIGWMLSRSTAVKECQAASLFDILERNEAARVTLAPLSPGAVTALITDTLGGPPDAATRELVAAASGNPLLIIELLVGLQDEGLLGAPCGDVSRGPVPDRVRTVVRRWVGPLSAEARSLVETVAVLGRTLPLEHAASLLGTTPAALLSVMEESTAAGILVVTERGLAFRHELVGDVVATGIPPPVRHALLEQFGVLLSPQPVGMPVTARLSGPTTTVIDAAICEGRLQEAEHMVRERLDHHGSVYGVAELRCLLSDIMYLTGRGDEAIREAKTVLAVPGLPRTVRERAILVRLYAMTRLRDHGAAQTCAQGVIDGGSRHGPATAAAALIALATIERDEGRLSGALALTEDAGRLAGVDRPQERRYEAHLATAAILTDVHQLDEARATLRQARTDMFAHGHLAWAADVAVLQARAELVAGRFDSAVTEAERALKLAAAHNTPLPAAEAGSVLATVALRRGDLQGARRHIAAPPGGSPEARARRALLAAQVIEAREGPRSAMLLLEDLPNALRGRSILAMDPTASVWIVRIALAADDRPAAEPVVAAAEALSQANVEFPALAASASHARGLLDGDCDALAFAAGQAVDVWARASAEEDLGVALKAAGRREEAAGSLDRALAIYHDLGSIRDAARTRQRLRGMGVRRRHWSYAERPVSGWDSLTETEHTVALHAVDGWTNRQIAEQMFLSVHTVAFHLRHVYRKLSINSRVELTHLAVAQGRVDPDRPHDKGRG